MSESSFIHKVGKGQCEESISIKKPGRCQGGLGQLWRAECSEEDLQRTLRTRNTGRHYMGTVRDHTLLTSPKSFSSKVKVMWKSKVQKAVIKFRCRALASSVYQFHAADSCFIFRAACQQNVRHLWKPRAYYRVHIVGHWNLP